jgi:hypothetical protein
MQFSPADVVRLQDQEDLGKYERSRDRDRDAIEGDIRARPESGQPEPSRRPGWRRDEARNRRGRQSKPAC